MIKQLLKDGFVYGSANILARGISILIIPLYTRIIAPRDFGIIDIFAAVALYVNVLITLEINQGFPRFFSDAKENIDKDEYASSTLWFTIFVYSIFFILVLVFSRSITVLLLDSLEWLNLFRVAVIAVCLNGIYYMLQNQLRWQFRAKMYAVTSIIYSLSTIGVTAILILNFKTGVIGMFYGQIAGASVGCLLSWFFARNRYKFIFSWSKCREMLHYSIPFVPSSVNVYIMLFIDRFLIKKYMSLSDVGLYGIGYRFATIVSLLMVGINGALSPLIFDRYTNPSTPSELSRIFRYFIVIALSLIIALAIFAKELLWTLTTSQYYSAWTIIPIISSAILLSNCYIFAPGIDIAKKTKYNAFINIIVALINTMLNIIFIPYWGILGAAFATLISSCTMFLLYMYYSQKFYYVPHNWNTIYKALTTFIIILAFCYFANNFIEQFIFIVFIIKIAISIVFALFFAFILLEREELTKIYSHTSLTINNIVFSRRII